jgi:integral membrane protein (TIGR01906 family)
VRRAFFVLLVCAIAVAIPGLLVANGVYLLAADWYVELVYDHGGIPGDRYGLTGAQRLELAQTGLHSILPWGTGLDVLRDAQLPGGDRAFGNRELEHMQDVQAIVRGLLIGHGIALAAIAVLAVGLARTGARTAVATGLRAGALLTFAIAALVGILVTVEYDWFSTGFHTLFFEGESWRFEERDTLRRLYPDRFWEVTAAVLAALAVTQAALVLAVSRRWLRRARVG